MNQINDEDIVQGLKTDDEISTRHFYNKYSRRLLVFIKSRGVFHTHEAEEIVHEVMIKTITNIDSFEMRTPKSFSTYIFTIAKNIIIDRSRKKHEDALDADLLPYKESLDDKNDTKSISGKVKVDKLTQEIYFRTPPSQNPKIGLADDILGLLSEQDRDLILYYLARYSYSDIAKYTGISESQVATYLIRARKRLEEKADIPGLAERIKDVRKK